MTRFTAPSIPDRPSNLRVLRGTSVDCARNTDDDLNEYEICSVPTWYARQIAAEVC
jgi:hypothetical protein